MAPPSEPFHGLPPVAFAWQSWHWASSPEVIDNTLVNNGTNPDPTNPFSIFASDIGLLTGGDHGNCYSGNVFTTFQSVIGVLPECPPPPAP